MIQTVTRDGWSVGTTTGTGIAGAILSVHRHRPGSDPSRYDLVPGDGNGRTFPDSASAFAWALERGYLQPYVHPYCARCRGRHWWLGSRTSPIIAGEDCAYYAEDGSQGRAMARDPRAVAGYCPSRGYAWTDSGSVPLGHRFGTDDRCGDCHVPASAVYVPGTYIPRAEVLGAVDIDGETYYSAVPR